MFIIGSSANFLPYLLVLSFSLIFCIEGEIGRLNLVPSRDVETEFGLYDIPVSEIVIQWAIKEAEPIQVGAVLVNKTGSIFSSQISRLILFFNYPHRAPPVTSILSWYQPISKLYD